MAEVGELLRGLLVFSFNEYQRLTSRFLPRWLLIRGGRLCPKVVGTRQKTPDERIDIEPGETVGIRSQREILDTLNSKGHSRGLAFDGDTAPRPPLNRPPPRRGPDRGANRRADADQQPCLVLYGVV